MSKNDPPKGVFAFAGGMIFVTIVGVLFSLGLTATIIWAIIQVVSWLVSQ